ncbi:uncharacterized protein PgNI_00004 [Pyricularia grisea]|uniref:Uncharacterized protein n=1 Tax=Pyricularia grisea TaxID=148305 RepID=A0A6P8BLB1_PYRGI|nr:uncharacterized protein PgNI_00004 [Pyricularia grisea]TLD17656.1 hypothetical protein PgNI_00004 [Pyricularia grisea]
MWRSTAKTSNKNLGPVVNPGLGGNHGCGGPFPGYGGGASRGQFSSSPTAGSATSGQYYRFLLLLEEATLHGGEVGNAQLAPSIACRCFVVANFHQAADVLKLACTHLTCVHDLPGLDALWAGQCEGNRIADHAVDSFGAHDVHPHAHVASAIPPCVSNAAASFYQGLSAPIFVSGIGRSRTSPPWKTWPSL